MVHLVRFSEWFGCFDAGRGRLCVCSFGRNLTALAPPAHACFRIAFWGDPLGWLIFLLELLLVGRWVLWDYWVRSSLAYPLGTLLANMGPYLFFIADKEPFSHQVVIFTLRFAVMSSSGCFWLNFFVKFNLPVIFLWSINAFTREHISNPMLRCPVSPVTFETAFSVPIPRQILIRLVLLHFHAKTTTTGRHKTKFRFPKVTLF